MNNRRRLIQVFYFVVIMLTPVTCPAGGMNSGGGSLTPQATAAVPGETPMSYYEDPIICARCHQDKFQQWQTDQHSRSWTGDFMVAQYFDLARPDGDLDPMVEEIKMGCVGCHSPSLYMALGHDLIDTVPPRPAGVENAWYMLSGNKTGAERGIFCDFCHTISAVGEPPVNFNYTSAATAAVDPKRGPRMMMGGGGMNNYHQSIYSPLHDSPRICGTCHDEIDPFGQMVKGTYTEWLNSPYAPDTRCQDCHMLENHGGHGGGGGGMMGMYSMNVKGGFAPFVQGVASLQMDSPASAQSGETIDFTITVTNDKVGHEFPSGSEEERQLWIHVTATDEAGHSWHVPVTMQPDTDDPGNPNHTYWVTTNALVAWPSPNPGIGSPIPRDGLPVGDRIYHSVFISPDYTGSKITYAQYYAAQIFSNRLKPKDPRTENYSWTIPVDAVGSITLRADLNYRRMPDSMADFLNIQRRPIVLVTSTDRAITLQ